MFSRLYLLVIYFQHPAMDRALAGECPFEEERERKRAYLARWENLMMNNQLDEDDYFFKILLYNRILQEN